MVYPFLFAIREDNKILNNQSKIKINSITVCIRLKQKKLIGRPKNKSNNMS